jgi:hypothetical protein
MAHFEIELLLKLLDEAYNRGVKAHEASLAPKSGRHNIWELVIHAAYWKYAVRRKLTGEKRGSFSIPGSNWFVLPSVRTEKAWRVYVAILDYEHHVLREAVAAFPPKALHRRAHGSKSSARRLIAGIALHDVYHAGQIQLIKKLLRAKSSS